MSVLEMLTIYIWTYARVMNGYCCHKFCCMKDLHFLFINEHLWLTASTFILLAILVMNDTSNLLLLIGINWIIKWMALHAYMTYAWTKTEIGYLFILGWMCCCTYTNHIHTRTIFSSFLELTAIRQWSLTIFREDIIWCFSVRTDSH